MSTYKTPKSPLRKVLRALTGVRPPDYTKRAHYTHQLAEGDQEKLQMWCVNNVRPGWLTGIGLMEAADSMVAEAVSNGNISGPAEDIEQIPSAAEELAIALESYKRTVQEVWLWAAGRHEAQTEAENAAILCCKKHVADLLGVLRFEVAPRYLFSRIKDATCPEWTAWEDCCHELKPGRYVVEVSARGLDPDRVMLLSYDKSGWFDDDGEPWPAAPSHVWRPKAGPISSRAEREALATGGAPEEGA